MAGYSTFLIFGEFGEICKCLGEKKLSGEHGGCALREAVCCSLKGW